MNTSQLKIHRGDILPNIRVWFFNTISIRSSSKKQSRGSKAGKIHLNLCCSNHQSKEDRFLEAVCNFSDHELITSVTMRFVNLSDQCRSKLLDEIHHRKLNNRKIRRLYTNKKFFKDLTSEDCPCCESSQHVIIRNKKVSFCLVCGYDIKTDNPKSILNRLKWKFGVYHQVKLSLKQVTDIIFHH